MSKRFDMQLVREYCDTMTDAYSSYASVADDVQYQCMQFADHDTFTGMQAMITKQMVSVSETGLLDDILDVNREIVSAQNRIMELFESQVDSASDALIDEDILNQMNNTLATYRDMYDSIARMVESIYGRLQKFSKYGCFTKPDFNSGRMAANALCGGDAGNGFLRDCIEKLNDYDSNAVAILMPCALEERMLGINNRIRNASEVMNTFQAVASRGGRFQTCRIERKEYSGNNKPSDSKTLDNDTSVHVKDVSQTRYHPTQDELFPDLATDNSVNDGFGELAGLDGITVTLGLNGAASLGLYSHEIGGQLLVNENDIGVQGYMPMESATGNLKPDSIGYGFTGTVSIGFFNTDDINDFEGASFQIGGQVGDGLVVGATLVQIINEDGEIISNGIVFEIGGGVAAGVHSGGVVSSPVLTLKDVGRSLGL